MRPLPTKRSCKGEPRQAACHAGQDAAAEVDAAARAQGQRQIAGGGAEKGQEELHGFGAAGVAALGEGGGAQAGLALRAVDVGERVMQPYEAGATHRALGRGMAEAVVECGHHGGFARGGGAQRDVAALAGERGPGGRGGPAGTRGACRDETAHPQARAGADERHRRARDGGATGELHRLVGLECGQCPRQCFEVVYHHQPLELQAAAQRLDGERPVVVGHGHRIARHRVGDADGRQRRARPAARREVALGCRLQRGMLGAGVGADGLDGRARCALPAEAGVGAADVGQQPRPRV